MSSLSLVLFADPEVSLQKTGPSVYGLAAHLQGGLWPAGLMVLGKGGGGLRPVQVQACTVTLLGPCPAGLLVFSVGPLCHAGAWPALRGPKKCSPIETMGLESAHQPPSEMVTGNLRGCRAGQVVSRLTHHS